MKQIINALIFAWVYAFFYDLINFKHPSALGFVGIITGTTIFIILIICGVISIFNDDKD